MLFLTDTRPSLWDLSALSAKAAAAVADPTSAAVRDWFGAANGLALALVRAGDSAGATVLMERSISAANYFGELHPNGISYGVDAWINRIELQKFIGETQFIDSLESCYSALRGRPIQTEHLFGFNLGRLGKADLPNRRNCLNLVRNRCQFSLLKAYLARDGLAKSVYFAQTVCSDYPNAVRAGMLQPVEVLCRVALADPFMDSFSPHAPSTEGDFVVLLGRLTAGTAAEEPDPRVFESALLDLEARHVFMNPRTPIIWRVALANAIGDARRLAENVVTGLAAARAAGDLQTYRWLIGFEPTAAAFPPRAQPCKTALQELMFRFIKAQKYSGFPHRLRTTDLGGVP